jgi:hypothetical protein
MRAVIYARYNSELQRAASIDELGFREPALNDIVEQLAPGSCTATPNVEDTFLGLLHQLIETFNALAAPLEDHRYDRGLSERLLVDERARHAEVSVAILCALLMLHERTTFVIIGFAGRGSPDGGLVLFDTDAADLAGIALPMAALADTLKRTKARTRRLIGAPH